MTSREELTNRDFAIVSMHPAMRELAQATAIRTSTSGLWQCTCGISAPYLAPVGQQPTAAILQTVPTGLLSSSQELAYGKPTTNSCWWDGYEFDGPMLGLPIKYKKVLRKLPKPVTTKVRFRDRRGKWQCRTHTQHNERVDGFVLHGIFCSWNCARAYGDVTYPSLRNFIGSWIYKILIEIGKHAKQQKLLPEIYRIPSAIKAPHFSLLKKYGGSMDITKFRRLAELDNNRLFSVIPSWLNVIPAGMVATDIPNELQNFRERYNAALTDTTDATTHRYTYTRPPPRKSPLHLSIPRKRKRVNRILHTIRRGK
jgi:hypothetical protein